jgi:hypothetical protein
MPPTAHSSAARRWLDEVDPLLGLSAPLVELIADQDARDRVTAAIRNLLPTEGAAEADAGWDLAPGAVLARREVHRRYGGQERGGIATPTTTPNVLLFTDPARGRRHGYYDGWGDDGCFYYTGEGQRGDQALKRGNRAIAQHRSEHRALRLFRAVGSDVEYVGRFEVDQEQPWQIGEAPETDDGPLRAVIVFRLHPVGIVQHFAADLPTTPKPTSHVEHVAPEDRHTDEFIVPPAAEPTTAQRREAELLSAYTAYLRSHGHEVSRLRIVPPQATSALYTDLFDNTTNELIEAKGTITRQAIRMAIGQLLDYRRFAPATPRMAVLLPSAPRPDLIELCTSLEITTIWRDGQNWSRAPT